jgi:predicted permease
MIVLTLALGIGAGTALFAYVIEIVRPVFDAPDPDRVVFVYMGPREDRREPPSYPELQHLDRHLEAVTDLAAFCHFGASVGVGEQGSTFAWAQAVTGSYFPFFAGRPARGRLLQPADDRPGAERVAVLSHFFWTGTLGGDPGIVGRRLRINGFDFTVVGVAAQGFEGQGLASAIYVPMAHLEAMVGHPGRLSGLDQRFLGVLGRLAPGVGLEQGRAALQAMAEGLDESLPLAEGQKRRSDLLLATRYDEELGEEPYVKAAAVLLAAALLFLLLACANVANLLLARAVERQREWGVRAALGAGRRHLLAGVMAEGAWLCAAGGGLGTVFAVALGEWLESYIKTTPVGLGSWGEGGQLIRLDARFFAFALGITLACALLSGLAPVLQGMRRDLLTILKSESGGTAAPTGALALRKILVVAQVALSALLLLGGSLLARTLHNAQQVDPGFPTGGLLTVVFYLPRNQTPGGQDAQAVYGRVLDVARTVPGVKAASLTHAAPLAGLSRAATVTTAEHPDELEVEYEAVAGGFFATMGIPILQGRPLDDRDAGKGTGAVVVSQQAARKLWGDPNPVGRLLTIPGEPRPGDAGPVFEVVGVAADVRHLLTQPPGPYLYLSSLQRRAARMSLVVRTAGPPAAVIPALREALRKAHPDLSVMEMATCQETIHRSLAEQRMHAAVAGLFALLGLGVAVIGLFGLLRYTVSLRGREIAIRMAMGAQPRDVLSLILRQGLALTALGLALGLLGAFGLTRLLASLLIGIEPADPLTFLAVPALLLVVTASAPPAGSPPAGPRISIRSRC